MARRITDGQRYRILRSYADGDPLKLIAHTFSIGESRVSKIAKEVGLRRHSPRASVIGFRDGNFYNLNVVN